MMKKLISVTLAIACCLSMSITCFAAESQDSENTSATFEIVPLSRRSYYGKGGVATLDYMSKGYIHWGITLNGTRVSWFEGNLHFNKLGTPFGTFDRDISTGSSSGTEDVKSQLSKGNWEVTLTGVATATNGNQYAVVDNATLPFYVS